ncbi:simple sugar transport system substrate-binding protein [Alkalispirochaeta americana]|uniref:Simple sugar transport system substrate-binding protein n=1 Tax=Alkalispirochaeta americana TaxID=159291 RepID=A0A1N6PRR8_9SPIO|nr:BMP family ABC transporter substrate-binding protein [Alkalispirochaeta americana]SIQ06952.1 simple sugar transport system substrate-binding protein [Alkalispirochaeta americana]
MKALYTALLAPLALLAMTGFVSCGGDSSSDTRHSPSGYGGDETRGTEKSAIGVFVPGVVDGSPTYEMLVRGVRRAVADFPGASATVVEGGFNQAGWLEGVMSMAASGRYDLIVTSNPSMPEIILEVAQAVPGVRFLLMDAYLPDHEGVHSILFNQREQAYLSGYFAGLLTTSDLPGATARPRIGLLAGQEFPIMNEVILPGYREGARQISEEITLDFRVLGNWFDAGKAQEIAADMIRSGSDTILTIAGGGNQGALSAARERGTYVLWYDDSGYDEGPGVVAGSSLVHQDTMTYQATKEALRGETPWGSARILGVADGAVGFDTEHPAFRELIPSEMIQAMEAKLELLRQGELRLEMTPPGT